ncbi:MAG TPA: hypothetical protein VHU84_03625, partial [Lacipirellulaceae bacterium]|nr:hypothetical protein [Lacipirellulaceae bacterium]
MNAIGFSAPLQRFAWKEYRTLRGFWLAVLGLGLLLDWLVGVMLAGGTDFLLVRLYVALGAATLYAAGAASIMFSLEHEDQTYDFLRGLPATWQTAFAGKLLVVMLSSLGLAAALIGVAFMVGGAAKPNMGHYLQPPFSILGVAIFEAIAWGTLFSQLIKRPLAAAIATLTVGSLAVNLTVAFTGGGEMAGTDPSAYATAIPVRLATVVAVLGLSAIVGRKWLTDGSGAAIRSGWNWGGMWAIAKLATVRIGRILANPATRDAGGILANSATKRSASRATRHGMMGPLLWQAWRESWRRLWFPVACGLGWMGFGVILDAAGVGQWGHTSVVNWIAPLGVLIIPALYGALAFSTDQRHEQVRFLAEHAAAPRYVWLSRHIVWLGALVTLCILAFLIILQIGVAAEQSRASGLLLQQEIAGQHQSMYSVQVDILTALTELRSATALLAWGTLAAYGLGQVCSMLLRSEIMAGFTALLLAAVLGCWVATMYAWELSGVEFVLPLAAGTMSATWLRAPDWIVGRNSWRQWLKPIAVVAIALGFVGLMLPRERLKQIGGLRSPVETSGGAATPSVDALARDQERKTEAATTANMYLKAWTMYTAPLEKAPLARWATPEHIIMPPGDIDEGSIPKSERQAFEGARAEERQLLADQHAAALKLAMAATERPTCQVDFDLTPDEIVQSKLGGRFYSDRRFSTYANMEYLQRELMEWGPYREMEGHEVKGVDVPFDHLMAALRMSNHLMFGQPTVIVCEQFERQQEIFKEIIRWAQDNARTSEELASAIKQLEAFKVWPIPSDTFMVEQRHLRDVLTGKELPLVLTYRPIPAENYLAYLANRLPWERERALRANVLATNFDANSASSLVHHVMNAKAGERRRPDFPIESYAIRYPAAATSYLFAQEYRARVLTKELYWAFCDADVCRRAAMVEIAMMMYRGDHDEYPATLAELAPQYLEREPLDPYTMQSFEYLPRGLDRPLRRISNDRAP